MKTTPADGDTFELCHPQRRIWYTESLYPGTGVSNLAGLLHFPGRETQLPLLGRAINRVIERNDALRLRLSATGSGLPRQHLEPFRARKFAVVRSDGDRAPLRAEAAEPLALLDADLFRLKLLILPDNRLGVFFRYHHIVVDALSVSLLNRRIVETFGRLANGEADARGGADPSYFGFLERETEYLASEAFREDEAFWLSELDAFEAPSVEREEEASIAAGRLEYELDRNLSDGLRAFCSENGTSLFRFLMAVFYLVFSRRDGASDIVVGTAHHNRVLPGDKEMAGMTVSTVPVRLRVDESLPFLDFLREASGKISACLAHQRYPFDLLAAGLRARGRDPRPLLRYFVNGIPSLDGDYAVERYSPGAELASLDIKINPNQRPQTEPLQLCADYRIGLFDEAAIRRLFSAMENLIRTALAEPRKTLREFEFLSKVEQAAVLSRSRGEAAPCDADGLATITAAFEAEARRRPEATALVDAAGRTSYGELRRKVDGLAAALVRRGAKPGVRIAVLTDRTADFVVAALAVMKTGGAYVPLGLETPASRIEYILRDANAALVLCDAPRAIPGYAGEVLVIGDAAVPDAAVPDAAVPDAAAPDAGAPNPAALPTLAGETPAYVIYTSGTTGEPKGVVVPHRALANFIDWNRSFITMRETDVATAFCSFMFDMSVAEIFTPLSCGATLHILPSQIRHSVDEMNRYFVKHGVGVACFTTRVGELFMRHVERTSLRVLMVGGESLRFHRAQGYELINAYGPTETTVYATAHYVDPSESVIPIGRPVANMNAYVVDRELRLVPDGESGELLLAGPQVALGYLDKPRQTSEAFVPNPHADGPLNAVAYRTGDLVRRSSDGALLYLGRKDRQIKVRGYRIEPAEIETLLVAQKNVKHCLVALLEEDGDARLCAFCAAPAGADPELLRASLAEKLPDYMIPSRFVVVPELPLESNGKTDLRALLRMAKHSSPRSGSSGTAPRTAAERGVAAVWRRALGLERCSVTDGFFELGGDSLKAMALFAELERRFRRRLPASLIFENPTIEKLARLVAEPSAARNDILVRLRPSGGDDADGACAPLYCVHDYTGDIMAYTALAAELDPARPLYGLRYPFGAPGMAGTLPERAAALIGEIRGLRPAGPYALLGYSFGGVVAFEMARQLRSKGETVSFLGIVDTPCPSGRRRLFSFPFAMLLHFLSFFRSVRFFDRIVAVLSNYLPRRNRNWFLSIVDQRRMQRLLTEYRPKPYDGAAVLFRGRRHLFDKDKNLGWKPLVAELTRFDMDADHISIMFEENTRRIARMLNKLLPKDGMNA